MMALPTAALASASSSVLELTPAPPPIRSRAVVKSSDPLSPLPIGFKFLERPALASIPLTSSTSSSSGSQNTSNSQRCHRCLRHFPDSSDGIGCGKCKLESYCSYECQELAWETYHHLGCRYGPQIEYLLLENRIEEEDRLAVRLLMKLVWLILALDENQEQEGGLSTSGGGGEGWWGWLSRFADAEEKSEKETDRDGEPSSTGGPSRLTSPSPPLSSLKNGGSDNKNATGTSSNPSQNPFINELVMFVQLLPQTLNQTEQKLLSMILSANFLSNFTTTQSASASTTTSDRISQEDGKKSENVLRFLFSRFRGNNHVVPDERLHPTGQAILPTISRYCNHSCMPSGVLSTMWDEDSEEIKYSVRSMRPLKTGEELTIPYLDPILPLSDRQSSLLTRYGFECTCPLCTFQSSIPAAIMTKTTPPTLQDLTDLFRLSVGPGMVSTIQRRPYAPRSLTPPPPIPSTSLTSDDRSHSTGTLTYLPSRIKIINIPTRLYACLKADNVKELTKVFDDAMHDGEWNIAAPTGSHVLGIYVVVYGWRYPLVALHLLDLAKVLFNAHMSTPLPSSQPGPTATAYELLLQAGVYLLWAKEALDCTVAQGGSLSDGLVDGGPHGEVRQLEGAVRGEWEYLQNTSS